MRDSVSIAYPRRLAFLGVGLLVAVLGLVVFTLSGCAAFTPQNDTPEEAARVEANKATAMKAADDASLLVPGFGPFIKMLAPLGIMLATGTKK